MAALDLTVGLDLITDLTVDLETVHLLAADLEAGVVILDAVILDAVGIKILP